MIRFSCIATCFNDAAIILDFFKEMMKQTYQPSEYILVDGGSKDNTVEAVKEFADKNNCPIVVLSGKRLNISEGYNEGIKAAKNDVLAIVGIGNKYDEHFFESLLDYYETHNYQVVYGLTKGVKTTHFSNIYNKLFVGGDSGVHPLPTNRGMLIEKGIFDKIGYFYEDLFYAGEDVEFYDLMVQNNVSIGYTEKAILYWETPKCFKEFKKQEKVYFIGHLQLYGVNRKQIIKTILFYICLIGYLVFFGFMFRTFWPYIFIPIGYCLFALKAKSFNPVTIFLKCYHLFTYVFYFLKYRKYSKPALRVHRSN